MEEDTSIVNIQAIVWTQTVTILLTLFVIVCIVGLLRTVSMFDYVFCKFHLLDAWTICQEQ